MICSTSTNHVHNLDVDLNNSNTNKTSPNSVNFPQPPANYPIPSLTSAFQCAIQGNNICELKALDKQYTHQLETNADFCLYNRFDLKTTHQTSWTTQYESWNSFKIKLIDEFWSINIFGREVNQIFDLLSYYDSIQE